MHPADLPARIDALPPPGTRAPGGRRRHATVLALAPVLAIVILGILLQCPAHADPAPGIRPILGIEGHEAGPGAEGLRVDAVEPSLPAARMGMAKGDILLGINGAPVRTARDVRAILLGMAKGQRLTARFRHGSTVVEKEDPATDIPVLPSYELIEGRGIRDGVTLGSTRSEVEKLLGRPGHEGRRGSLVSLEYPRHGIVVGLTPLDGQARVTFIMVHFPFVGVTSRGLSTEARASDIPRLYRGERTEDLLGKDGSQNVSLPDLGVVFMCSGDTLLGTVLVPPEPAALPVPVEPRR